MTLEEIVKLADWTRAGDIDGCEVTRCIGNAEKYAHVGREVFFFCKSHFAEYLRQCDNLREGRLDLKERKS